MTLSELAFGIKQNDKSVLLCREKNYMTVKELINVLNTFDENLQVAIFNGEYLQHSSEIDVKIRQKRDDASYPYGADEHLEDRFVSISEA